MSDEHDEDPRDHNPHQHGHAAPSTQQMRTVGQRRRESEQKLDHHPDEARHKDDHGQHFDNLQTDTGKAAGGEVDGADVAAIQNDERLTAADRVDLIANQAIPETDDKGTQPDNGNN